MEINRWLNECSDEDDPDDFDDDENDPDFEIPGLSNMNMDSEESNEEDNVENNEEDSIEVNNDVQYSNDAQNNIVVNINQLNWGPVIGNLNDIPYNPENDFVGINPDIIDCMSGCTPYEL